MDKIRKWGVGDYFTIPHLGSEMFEIKDTRGDEVLISWTRGFTWVDATAVDGWLNIDIWRIVPNFNNYVKEVYK